MQLESNPVVQPIAGCTVDTLLDVKLRPVIAVGDPEFFSQLGRFFAAHRHLPGLQRGGSDVSAPDTHVARV